MKIGPIEISVWLGNRTPEITERDLELAKAIYVALSATKHISGSGQGMKDFTQTIEGYAKGLNENR